jgi:hypothetical protein
VAGFELGARHRDGGGYRFVGLEVSYPKSLQRPRKLSHQVALPLRCSGKPIETVRRSLTGLHGDRPDQDNPNLTM